VGLILRYYGKSQLGGSKITEKCNQYLQLYKLSYNQNHEIGGDLESAGMNFVDLRLLIHHLLEVVFQLVGGQGQRRIGLKF
jgi:hypothetical protein